MLDFMTFSSLDQVTLGDQSLEVNLDWSTAQDFITPTVNDTTLCLQVRLILYM